MSFLDFLRILIELAALVLPPILILKTGRWITCGLAAWGAITASMFLLSDPVPVPASGIMLMFGWGPALFFSFVFYRGYVHRKRYEAQQRADQAQAEQQADATKPANAPEQSSER